MESATPQKMENFKVGAFGEMTAGYLADRYQIHCDLIGKSNALENSILLKRKVSAHDVTFIIGSNSLRSVQKADDYWNPSPECIVYRNSPKSMADLGEFEAVLLTSPMNVSAFVQNNGLGQTYICIGPSTANHAKTLGLSPIIIAPYPSESGMTEALSNHFGGQN